MRESLARYLIESAPQTFPQVMIGTKLAHCEITTHLGSGGIGDVYHALDSKLGRSVAIKFLPEAFTTARRPFSWFVVTGTVMGTYSCYPPETG